MGSVRRSSWKPYVLYLLLNVVVSAVTVMLVLAIFGRGPRQPEPVPTATVDVVAQVASAVPTQTPTTAPSPTPNTYTVRAGDTLSDIAAELDVSVEALMAANRLQDANALSAGQVLIIPGPEDSVAASDPSATSTATPRPPTGQVMINAVDGAGDLALESVRLLNTGGEISMAGWQLDDGEGHTFRFPEFTFYSTGAIDVHTRGGNNTTIDLYWGLDQPLWTPGKVITLRDASGAVQSTFKIP